MPPKDASGCVVMISEGGDVEAEKKIGIREYVERNGYMPPEPVICVVFDRVNTQVQGVHP